MDKEVLNNGITYFLGPLLVWTLAGVVKSLLAEIHRRGFNAPFHLEVLKTLLLSPSCPPTVLRLSASAILRLFPTPKQDNLRPGTFNPSALRLIALKALGRSVDDSPQAPPPTKDRGIAWTDYGLHAIRDALAAARTGKAPTLDINRCLLFTSPPKFLTMLWRELVMAAAMGEMEAPRRIATFVLTMPRGSHSPPLLPIFLHILLPGLVNQADGLSSSDQMTTVELLIAIVTSTLTSALHLEYALLSVCGEQYLVLGQSVAAMSRRLGSDLRKDGNGQTARILVQRLASLPTFVANFPTFMADF